MNVCDGRVWSIVLAGGDGERVRPLVERWLGRHVPKQYCAFVGTRSMLEHTLDRAVRVSPPNQTVTVIARSHQTIALPRHQALRSGVLVLQPFNRDTAAGVYVALSYVRATDPGAKVAIFPSDHFVHPEDCFVQAVKQAVSVARQLDRPVLLGVEPEHLELEYGWITPGPPIARFGARWVFAVKAFVEKPTRELAEGARRRGALWNTMVVTATVESLWRLGWIYLPELMVHFERLVEVIGTPREADVLETVYAAVPRRNFSSDLMQRASSALIALELTGVTWSDWGDERRIEATIRQLGKTPAFAVAV